MSQKDIVSALADIPPNQRKALALAVEFVSLGDGGKKY